MKFKVGFLNELEQIDDENGKPRGYVWTHRTPDSKECVSFVDLVVHRVLSENPLSLSPSLDCPACPAHGFVENSMWKGPGVLEPRVDVLVPGSQAGVWRLV